MDYVGIVRTDKRLQRAKRRVDLLSAEIAEYYGNFRVTNDLLELRTWWWWRILSSSQRWHARSRGLHYTLDYPELDTSHPPQNTVLIPESFRGRH